MLLFRASPSILFSEYQRGRKVFPVRLGGQRTICLQRTVKKGGRATPFEQLSAVNETESRIIFQATVGKMVRRKLRSVDDDTDDAKNDDGDDGDDAKVGV